MASASQIPKRNLWRQSRSPRPTGATLAVCSNGPMYLRHGFRQPNFVPKFRASVMGIGPYASRGDEGRHAGSSCPTGGCGVPPRSPWVAAHSGASAARVRRNGRESRQRSSLKCPATPDNPSVSLRLTAPFAQGSLGDEGCGLPRRFAPRNDSSKPLSFRGGPTGRRGNPSFLRWTWVRAAESSAPTGGCREPPQPPGQRSERGKRSWSNSVFAR